jgi:hypothetical protein
MCTASDLVRVKVQRNPAGEIVCPCTFKVLNEHSHIIVVGASGHLYSYDALRNMKGASASTYSDFSTGKSFTLADIITIQDPASPRKLARPAGQAAAAASSSSQASSAPTSGVYDRARVCVFVVVCIGV